MELNQHRLGGLFFLPAVVWSPPPYANAGLYEERELTMGGKPKLPATLTIRPHSVSQLCNGKHVTQ